MVFHTHFFQSYYIVVEHYRGAAILFLPPLFPWVIISKYREVKAGKRGSKERKGEEKMLWKGEHREARLILYEHK